MNRQLGSYQKPPSTLWRVIKWLLILGVLCAGFLLVSAPFYIYGRFNVEQPVAEIWFQQLGDKRYQAHVATGDLCSYNTYEILGDQWQLDASFIKWKGLGTMLGLPSLYRLDRLSGRYANIDEQNVMEKRSHDLSPGVLVDLIPAESAKGLRGMLVDTKFGSSVYLDIDVAHRYRVYKTEDALIARVMERAAGTEDSEITVTIDKACGQAPGFLDRWSRRANDLVLSVL